MQQQCCLLYGKQSNNKNTACKFLQFSSCNFSFLGLIIYFEAVRAFRHILQWTVLGESRRFSAYIIACHLISFMSMPSLMWLHVYDIIVNLIINIIYTGSKFLLSVYNADNGYVEPKPVCRNLVSCCSCFLTCPALWLHFPMLPVLCAWWSFTLAGTLHSATIPFGFFLGGGCCWVS